MGRLPERMDDRDLVVRRWTADDASALHRSIERNVDHLRPWMPWIGFEPQTLEQRAELIALWEHEWESGGDVVLGVFLDGAPVGGTGFHRRIGPDGLEIGYWVDRDHIGQGLAPRVVRLLTDAAFTVDGITHVEVHCDESNLASSRVPEKLGFIRVDDIGVPPVAAAETGVHRVYRMDRNQWVARVSPMS